MFRVIEKPRVGNAGADDEHADAMFAQLEARALRQAFDGEFAGAVGAAERHGAEAVDR